MIAMVYLMCPALQKRPSSRAAPTVGLFGTEAHHANTTTDLLKGEAWQLLLSRIGDTLMLFLLMHTSLFLPLPNGCFLQVTGASIAEVSQSVLQTRYLNAFASA